MQNVCFLRLFPIFGRIIKFNHFSKSFTSISKGGIVTFYNTLLNQQKVLERKIASINKNLNKLPEENLCCAKNGNTYKWYSCLGSSTSYIRKNDRKYAEKLALKKYYLLELDDLTRELRAISDCLSRYPATRKTDEFFEKNTEFQKLISDIFKPSNKDLALWASEDYEKNTSHPENLKHKTIHGYYVRSKSELLIDNMLTMNKIPFRYECCLNLNGISLYPDFTIMHPKSHELFYWEHFGMIDNPTYANNAMSKLHNYISNGIYPNINLITTYETKDKPLDTSTIEALIKLFLL